MPEHLEVLGYASFGCLCVVECGNETDSFEWRLRHAAKFRWLFNSNRIESCWHHVDDVCKLRSESHRAP